MKKLELACFSLPDALGAAALGVDRIEFCEDYSSGGLTPNFEQFSILRTQYPKLPIHVMIRTRPGSFVHTEEEIELMCLQIKKLRTLGADGFVFGVLNKNHEINSHACLRLILAAAGKPCVFHRAFDELLDPTQALEDLISLGFFGVLSSGGPTTALDGLEVLNKLYNQAKHRIQVIAGGGIRSANLQQLISSDLEWFHSAAWDKEQRLMDAGEIAEMLQKRVLFAD